MPLTNTGRDFLVASAVVPATLPFNNANSRVGVGNGATVFAAAQTDLQGASKVRKAVDATFPTVVGNVMTFRATFGTGEANFAWEEWGIFNDAAAGTMLNRKQESLGTKPNTQTWQFTVTLTVNAA